MWRKLLVLFIFFSAFLGRYGVAQTAFDYKVERVRPDKNIYLPQISCIKQDEKGFLWFSSGVSLYRFDGKNAKGFKMDFPLDLIPYEEKTIKDFVFDSEGNVWLATVRGLVRFLVEEEKFCFFEHSDLHLADFTMKVLAVEEIKPGQILFNNKNHLLILSYKSSDDLPEGQDLKLQVVNDIPIGNVDFIEKTSSGKIWLGGKHGVCTFSNFEKFEDIVYWPKEYRSKYSISSFFEDKNGMLWLGVKGAGVWGVNLNKKSLYNIVNHRGTGFLSNVVYQITGNDKAVFYSTSEGVGAIKYEDISTNGDIKLKESSIRKDLLEGEMIVSVFSDNSGVIWAGSILKGLYKIVAAPKIYEIFNQKKTLNLSPYFNNSSKIVVDSNDDVWHFDRGYFRKRKKEEIKNSIKIEFEGGLLSCRYFQIYDDNLFVVLNKGLEVFDIKTLKRVKSPEIDFLKSFAKGKTFIEFIRDRKGNYWFLDETGELILVSLEENNKYKTKVMLPGTRSFPFRPSVLFSTSDGKVWFYMIESGLHYYDPTKEVLLKFEFPDHLNMPKEGVYVNCFMEDSKHVLWLGTQKGIFRIYPENLDVERIKDVAPDMVFSLMEDDFGSVWGTAPSNFFRVNKVTDIVEEYELENDGFDIGFFPELGQKFSDGSFLYPLTNGGVMFVKPDLVLDKNYEPKVTISEIRIHNTKLEKDKIIYGKHVLEKGIPYLNELNLKFNQKNLSFGFRGLDYLYQNHIIYEYRMLGLNDLWIRNSSENPFVNYSNLQPGTYKFQVRASYSGDFTNSEITNLKVTISKAWWKTPIAYLVYTLLIAMIIYSVWRYTLERVKLKEQIKLERFRYEKEHELNQAKLEFFTNISHEFKTPLSLLIGPLNKLIRNNVEDSDRKNLYALMFRNADRLLRLINQIMDFQKVAKGKLNLRVIHDNLPFYIRNIYNSFLDAAAQKDVDIDLRCDKDFTTWFDPDIVEKIISNLIFNAIKYTNPGGSIRVEVVNNEKEFCVIVEDSGIGISAEDLEHIFDRFYRVDNKRTQSGDSGGTGIGLALTKQLVELHKGKISVESKLEEGSRFIVRLACEKELFSEEELVFEKIKSLAEYSVEYESMGAIPESSGELEDDNLIDTNGVKSKVLIVEDDYDLRKFLKEFFKTTYKVYEAENGEKGLKMAREKAPDILISDVMMPVMNGLEFCRNVKEDMAISHIPVVLLTAKTKIEHQIEGLETGADAYVPKPFDPHYLEVVIRNLIATRKQLREKFDRKFVELTTDELKLTNADQHFLDKVIQIIEDNISNTDFRMENVYSQLGMGRTHFHNKMKAITNQTGGDFIRTVRLKRAAHLLKNHKIRVSDVCYDVGFNDPKYFGKVFRKYFGVSPREYAKGKDL